MYNIGTHQYTSFKYLLFLNKLIKRAHVKIQCQSDFQTNEYSIQLKKVLFLTLVSSFNFHLYVHIDFKCLLAITAKTNFIYFNFFYYYLQQIYLFR